MSPRLKGVLFAFAFLIAPSCTGGADSSTNSLTLLSCSLGCSSSGPCSVNSIASNQPIRFVFSQTLNPASIHTGTVQVAEVNSGIPASGTFHVKENTITFQPSILFDALTGTPSALPKGVPFSIILPGSNDSKSTVYSQSGEPLSQKLSCTVVPDGTLVDSVPGSPSVRLESPSDPVIVVFDDFMNAQTVFNPTTKTSPAVFIELDFDGDVQTLDRATIPGEFEIAFPSNEETLLLFKPNFVIGGSTALLVVVTVLPTAQDLAGNGVSNPGVFHFTVPPLPEEDQEVIVREQFTNANKEDWLRTGALWNVGGHQNLRAGPAGGIGFVDLFVDAHETLDLDAGNIGFELPRWTPSGESCNAGALGMEAGFLSLPVNNQCEDVSMFRAIMPSFLNDLTNLSIGNGLLPVQSFQIVKEGSLIVRGRHPLRIFTQGASDIRGMIDLSGKAGEGEDFSDNPAIDQGGRGGLGGPGGGNGGNGGDAPLVPGGVVDGGHGEGRGTAMPGTNGAGMGSPAHPPGALENLLAPNLELGNLNSCATAQSASGAGGGGFFLSGQNGGIKFNIKDPGPVGSGGPAVSENPFQDPYGSDFTGGAGGGGSGTSPNTSSYIEKPLCQNPPIKCSNPEEPCIKDQWNALGCLGDYQSGCVDSPTQFPKFAECCVLPLDVHWRPGSGGGGGGGTLLLQSGRDTRLTGRILARGGLGGGLSAGVGGAGAGGGSGGLVLIQSPRGLLGKAEVVSALGGPGGFGQGVGGAGGAGKIRVEVDPALAGGIPEASEFVGSFFPIPETGALTIPDHSPNLSAELVSSGVAFDKDTFAFDKMSTAVSRYYEIGNFFIASRLDRFEVDLITNSGLITVSFPEKLETPLGTAGLGLSLILHNTPIAFYFQGAQRAADGAPVPGSETPWTIDPRVLTEIYECDLIRFTIVFDRSFPSTHSYHVLSVEEIRFAIQTK